MEKDGMEKGKEGENERYLDMLKPYCSDSCIANYFKNANFGLI